jgi:hypothetical protein
MAMQWNCLNLLIAAISCSTMMRHDGIVLPITIPHKDGESLGDKNGKDEERNQRAR